MNSGSGLGGRHVGVRVPEEQQSPGTGRPRSVESLARAETWAVRWVDDAGAVHVELMHRIGDFWHKAPNGENYASTLRPMPATSWLGKLCEEERARQLAAAEPVVVPDAQVDVG